MRASKRTFNMPRLKSQIWLILFLVFFSLACGKPEFYFLLSGDSKNFVARESVWAFYLNCLTNLSTD